MKIKQTRIRLPENYLSTLAPDENFYIGFHDLANFELRLKAIGIEAIAEGIQVLPSLVGSVTRFNANGSFRIRRDVPKETMFREAEITDWHGNPVTVTIPYQRYQREPIPAPCIELLIRNDTANNLVLVSPKLKNNPQDYSLIKHVINLFLEIFGECDILQDNLLPTFNVPVVRLNWEVLPRGNYLDIPVMLTPSSGHIDPHQG